MAAAVTASTFNATLDGNPAQQTTSINVASGDKWAVVLIHLHKDSHTLNSVTFNGAAMTSLGTPLSFGGDSSLHGYRYDVSALSPGSYNVLVTANSDTSGGDMVTGIWVLNGAGQPTNWTTGSNTGASVNLAVTSAVNGIVIWGVSQDGDSTLDPAGGETEVYDGQYTPASEWYFSSGYHKASSASSTAANITMTSGTWQAVGVYVPEASGGGGGGSAVVVNLFGL